MCQLSYGSLPISHRRKNSFIDIFLQQSLLEAQKLMVVADIMQPSSVFFTGGARFFSGG